MIKKVLLVKYRFIGDAILAFPAFSAIRENYPDAKIDLLTEPLIASLMHGNPWGINPIVVNSSKDVRGLKGLLRIAGKLRQDHYDISMNFIHEYTLRDSLLPFLAGIPVRVGFCAYGKMNVFNRRVGIEGDKYISHHGHMTAIIARIPERIGIEVRHVVPELWVLPEADTHARGLLEAHGLHPSIVGIHPGAGNPIRCWPLEYFAEVARCLTDHFKASVVCTGSGKEADSCGTLVDMIGRTGCVSLAGKTNISQLIAVISRTRLFISNSSGPMHIAAALKIPLIALRGADEGMWDPLGDGLIVQLRALTAAPCYNEHSSKAQAFSDALRSISPDQVIEHIRSMYKDVYE